MYEWIGKEIAHIGDDAIVAPNYFLGANETLLPEAIVPVELRKVYTRILELSVEINAILRAEGLLSEDGILIDAFVPQNVQSKIDAIAGRVVALQSVLCVELMALYDLWRHAAVAVGRGWEVYYRTQEQERRMQEIALSTYMFNNQRPEKKDTYHVRRPFLPDDPNVN